MRVCLCNLCVVVSLFIVFAGINKGDLALTLKWIAAAYRYLLPILEDSQVFAGQLCRFQFIQCSEGLID